MVNRAPTQDAAGRFAAVPFEQRLWAKVDVDVYGCWRWLGGRGRYGHGMTYRNGVIPAYRATYELLVGPIPTGLVLDHLCNNPPCVNPLHLEPVTLGENNRRRSIRRLVCGNGHPVKDHGVRWSDGKLQCRICKVETTRRWRERNPGK